MKIGDVACVIMSILKLGAKVRKNFEMSKYSVKFIKKLSFFCIYQKKAVPLRRKLDYYGLF